MKGFDSINNDGERHKLANALILSVIFLIAELILVSFHEFWRDEVEDWALTFNSHSVSELFHLTRYDAQGKLWYLLLYEWQFLTSNIASMKILHIILAAISTFVFCYFSPLKRFLNILICFGYFFAYEYSIMSRNYILELLFLFLGVGIYLKYKGRHLLLVSICIFLLFQTNVYGIIIGNLWYGFLIFKLINTQTIKPIKLIASISIILLGLFIAIYFIIPPSDARFNHAVDWRPKYDVLINTINTIYTAYIPFPQLKVEFWNTNITDGLPSFQVIQFLLSALLLVAVTKLFYRNKKVLLLFYSATIGLLLFCYFKYFGYQRHHGQLFVLFILCYWLYIGEDKGSASSNGHNLGLLNKYFVSGILFIHLSVTVVAAYHEINYPFSNAVKVADYLKKEGLDELNMAGDEYTAAAVAGIMDKEIYYPQTKRSGKYMILDDAKEWLPEQGIIDKSYEHFAPMKEDFLLLMNNPIAPMPGNYQLLASFDHAIVGDENFYIYRVKPN